MKKPCFNKLLFFIALSFLWPVNIFAQKIDTTIIARVMLVHKYSKINKKHIAAISITIINTSNKAIYIPNFFNANRDFIKGGKLKIFAKNEENKNIYVISRSIGKEFPDTTSFKTLPGNTVPGKLKFGKSMPNNSNEIIDKYLFVSEKKTQEKDSILSAFTKHTKATIISGINPLFLNVHEAYEINLIKNVDELVSIAGEYKVFYELALTLGDAKQYPKEIVGYQLFIPNKITSNILYLKVEP